MIRKLKNTQSAPSPSGAHTGAELRRQALNIVVALLAFLAIVMGVAFVGYRFFGDEPDEIQGQVEAREYRVAAKVTARVRKVMVEEGQYVHKGDTLVVLEAPEIAAQEQAAQATAEAARAISDMTHNGTRGEDIGSARELVSQAEAARDIARKTYRRMQNLLDEGVISAQKRDEALAALQVAEAQVGAARSQYEKARNGAREEQRRAAAEQARAARNGTEVVRSLLRETVQVASHDGEVDKVYVHDGELVSSGTSVMSINLLDDVWGKFNIREDRLGGLRPGTEVTAYSPSLRREYRLKVYFLEAADDYATWRAEKPNEGYDRRTFEVRARPLASDAKLRPGMLLVLKQ